MPWRGHNGQQCKGCGRNVSECGSLSARYLCADCGEGALLGNRRQLRAHDGPWFLHWRRGVAASVGGVLLDDLEQSE